MKYQWYQQLESKYPGHVFIDRVSLQYTLRKKSAAASSTATLIQFPIRLAFAIKAHKIQGASIQYPTKVAMDIDSSFQAGQAYVMLSRVQCLEQVLIVGNITESRIMVSRPALDELNRLEKISVNRNPSIWMRKNPAVIKIASFNCAGLKAHFEDIIVDKKLLIADILLLQETSLLTTDTFDYSLDIFPFTLHIKIAAGKGISLYSKIRLMNEQSKKNPSMQLLKFEISGITVVCVYRSQDSNQESLCPKLKEVISESDPLLIFWRL